MVGVDAAKTALYDRLKIGEVGPGYCHFPIGRDQEYFDQLTAERKFTRYHNGYPKQEWRKPPAARNEALDCRVYAYAALQALYASGLKLGVHCDRFAKMATPKRIASKLVPPPKPRSQAQEEVAAGSDLPRPFERVNQEPWIPRRNWF
jgi:phage terminase large subunit GpA-like protein